MTEMHLQTIEEAGTAVLTLMEGIDESEFSRSRLTRQEVCRQLDSLGLAAFEMSSATRAALPEIDWKAWLAMAEKAAQDNQQLWWVITELVPTTLMWLRVYRNQQPELFAATTS
jgi:uncharacterized protein with HEPN domain